MELSTSFSVSHITFSLQLYSDSKYSLCVHHLLTGISQLCPDAAVFVCRVARSIYHMWGVFTTSVVAPRFLTAFIAANTRIHDTYTRSGSMDTKPHNLFINSLLSTARWLL